MGKSTYCDCSNCDAAPTVPSFSIPISIPIVCLVSFLEFFSTITKSIQNMKISFS